MAAEKEPFLVPAPPPPLKDESGGGGGPEVRSHREAASGELRDGSERGPGPRAPSSGAAGGGGGGPQAQAHGELLDPAMATSPTDPPGVAGAKEEIAVT